MPGQLDRGGGQPLPAGEAQQLTGQTFAAPHRLDDGLHGLRELGLFGDPPLQEVGVAADHHQKVVEVVGDPAGKLAEGLHLLRLDQLFLGLLQLQLRFPALGDVAGDLGVAQQPALGIADRVDQHAGPEHRAVLAHAPALGLVLAVGGGVVQRLHRQARPTVGVGIELGEMQTDDLVGGVALDPLGAGVPAGHHPVGIQHDQRAVVDAFHEDAELPLALQQGLLGRLPLCDVAGGVDEADDGSPVVADDLQRGLRPEPAPVLTDPPAFALEMAARQGRLQRAFGQAAAAILLAVEQGDVPADGLVGRIAGDPLRPGIPAGHQPLRIHQEDGVVGDGVQKHLEAPVVRDGLQWFHVDARAPPCGKSRPAFTRNSRLTWPDRGPQPAPFKLQLGHGQ